MAFLNPLILLALPLAAVPFFLHLMRRRRAPHVEFTYLKFLEQAHRQRFLSFQVQELLLLSLRTLLILLIILALAGPTLPPGNRGLFRDLLALGTPGREILVVVDNSMSMSAQERGATRLAEAAELAETILRDARASDRVRLLSSQELLSEDSAFAVTGDEALEALATISPTTGTYDAAQLLERAALSLESADMGMVMVLSDWQASPWREFSATSLPEGSPARRTEAVFVDVPRTPPRNVWFAEVDAPGLPPLAGEPAVINLKVAQNQATEPREVVVTARDSADEILDSRLIALPVLPDSTTPAEVETSVSFLTGAAAQTTSGLRPVRGSIAFDFRDQPADDLAADNQFGVDIQVIQGMDVLIVTETGDTWSPFVLQVALEIPTAEGVESPVRTEVVTVEELPGVILERYQAVVLATSPDLPEDRVFALEEYVREGGGLFWLMTPAGEPEPVEPEIRAHAPAPAGTAESRWLSLLDNLMGTRAAEAQSAADSRSGMFGLRHGPAWESVEGLRMDGIHWEHPVLLDLREFGEGAFGGIRFWRGMDIGEVTRPLIRADGRLLLAEKEYGQGRVMVMASSLGKDSSDLAVQSIFLPLLIQSVKYLGFHETGAELTRPDPEESNLRVLSAAERLNLEGQAPVRFVQMDDARRIASQGTAGRSLTSPLLVLCVLLSLMELAAANLRH